MTTEADFHEHADPGVEPEGVHALSILSMTVVGAVILVAVVVVGIQLAKAEFRRAIVESTTVSGYPALQQNRIDAQEKLTQYGVADVEAGRYRIPIDRAVDLMVNEAARDGDRPVSDQVRLTR